MESRVFHFFFWQVLSFWREKEIYCKMYVFCFTYPSGSWGFIWCQSNLRNYAFVISRFSCLWFIWVLVQSFRWQLPPALEDFVLWRIKQMWVLTDFNAHWCFLPILVLKFWLFLANILFCYSPKACFRQEGCEWEFSQCYLDWRKLRSAFYFSEPPC